MSWPLPLLMVPIIWDLFISSTQSGGVIFSFLLTMSTISWSVFWRSPCTIGTLWNRSDVRRPYCSSSSILPFSCDTSWMSFRLSAFSFLLSAIKVAVLFVTFLNFSYLASTLAMLDFTCSFSWLFSFSRHFILFWCSLINWRRGLTTSSMASATVDLIADFNSLISSALISFNKVGTIFLIKSGFNKVSVAWPESVRLLEILIW